jgi:hypothetical protein
MTEEPQKENSNNSSDDDAKNRSIMLWTAKIENYLLDIKEKAKKKSIEHNKYYKKYKIFFYSINIPEAILLFILSSTTIDFKNDNEELTNTITILAGVLSLINSFVDPGKLNTEHLHYKNLYEELIQQIEIELVKSKSLRTDAEIFLSTINNNYNSLNNKEPNL